MIMKFAWKWWRNESELLLTVLMWTEEMKKNEKTVMKKSEWLKYNVNNEIINKWILVMTRMLMKMNNNSNICEWTYVI